jgi:hypothetical protein
MQSLVLAVLSIPPTSPNARIGRNRTNVATGSSPRRFGGSENDGDVFSPTSGDEMPEYKVV